MRFRFTRLRPLTTIVTVLLIAACGNDQAQAPAVEERPQTPAATSNETAKRRIVFFGDSITAGYGLDPANAYPAVIQDRIDERGWPFVAVNAGVSGETSAGGLRRIDWILQNPVDVLVLELGANDGLRGLSVEAMKSNLEQIIRRTREENPDVAVVVAGMRMPPNLGERYASDFGAAFSEVAKSTDAGLIPFLLQDVAGHPLLNQSDGIHPTAKGQKILADNVWNILEPILERRLDEEPGA